MSADADGRLPLVFGTAKDITRTDAVLLEASVGLARDVPNAGAPVMPRQWFAPETGHAFVTGCPCCISRTDAAKALSQLVHERGQGKTAYFTRIIAVTSTPAGLGAIRRALATDPIASAYVRVVPGTADSVGAR